MLFSLFRLLLNAAKVSCGKMTTALVLLGFNIRCRVAQQTVSPPDQINEKQLGKLRLIARN
jgi:hypothetical protein